jgi:hypothetical protein
MVSPIITNLWLMFGNLGEPWCLCWPPTSQLLFAQKPERNSRCCSRKPPNLDISHGKCLGNAGKMKRSMEVNWPGVYHPKKYWPYRPHQDSRNSPRSDTHQIILIESLWSTSNHLLDSFFFGGNPHIYPLGSHGWEVQHGMIMQGVSLTKTWHGHSCHFHARELFEKKNSFETTN